ncbi:MAG: hypothetical protein A2W91_01830 [Bacteroidetes bacterium GWF2_38_335]|nr:MAG: hypothetical protein A2W91_01830 [Bacteroidetes bacterium GWF2_38_335]OFY78807.1 MAG: hypothetical protein A2281_19405 [Bacteroidetes bacterium RIFOXYA12_FULL_38_20]HBS85204.1 hypothetical protein [Bacteroidales bacterium]
MKTKTINFILLICFISLLYEGCKKEEEDTPDPIVTVTDIDGNVYHTITIGTQVWMVENFKVTHFRNGDSIPNITDDTQWSSMTTSAYCNYENSSSNSTTYGRLYNWYVINDTRNICPEGWHVPTQEEWTTLVDFLGGLTAAGGKIKEIGTAHWFTPNTGATNSSGFTGLPAGTRNTSGSFSNIGNHGYWWSSSNKDDVDAWEFNTNYNHADMYKNFDPKNTGFSIRLIKD